MVKKEKVLKQFAELWDGSYVEITWVSEDKAYYIGDITSYSDVLMGSIYFPKKYIKRLELKSKK